MLEVKVIGAGLAGCEAAWQLAERGIHVTLTEMKPHKMTPAHHCADFAELVCSNSLRGDRLENAVGLLKEELRRLHSLILPDTYLQTLTLISRPDPQSQRFIQQLQELS